jgi:hypothetical protein
VVASDKLFYWLFQQRAERLQPLVTSLLPQMEGMCSVRRCSRKGNTGSMACFCRPLISLNCPH